MTKLEIFNRKLARNKGHGPAHKGKTLEETGMLVPQCHRCWLLSVIERETSKSKLFKEMPKPSGIFRCPDCGKSFNGYRYRLHLPCGYQTK